MSKSDALFVTDAECARRIGLTTDQFKGIVSTLAKSGFPDKDLLFANRRYWPAVRAWLDKRHGIGRTSGITAPPGPDGAENWD